VGFGTDVGLMVAQAITYATQLFGDFYVLFALLVGLFMVGYIIRMFIQ